MRALQWLSNKDVLTVETQKTKMIHLGKNATNYKKEGMPEKRLAKALTSKFQAMQIIAESAKLSTEEVNASIGQLKRHKAVGITKDNNTLELKATEETKNFTNKKSLEEKFLNQDFPTDYEKLDEDSKQAIKLLSKRKDFIDIKDDKIVKITVKKLGKELSKLKINQNVTSRLTPGMLKDGSWRKKEFRAYDVEINVPAIHPGKKHFVNQAVDYIKNIWIEMGFEEMQGDYVHSAFWDLDALFVPQDHPARLWQCAKIP